MALPVRVLFANLSLAQSDTSQLCQNKVRDAVKSFFTWYSNEDAGLETVILRSKNQAVIYLSNHAIADRLLLAQNPVPLSGPLTALFSSADLVPTEMVTVLFNSVTDVLEQITNVVRDVQGVLHIASSNSQVRSAIIKFSSSKDALTAIKPLGNIQGVTHAKVVQFSDHRVLHFIWNGELGIAEATKRLSQSGFCITGLLQHVVSLWDSQPTILTAQSVNFEKIDIVCATMIDADVLLARKRIDLPSGGYLSIVPTVIPAVIEREAAVFSERIDLLKLSFSAHLRNIHGWNVDGHTEAEDQCNVVYEIETKLKRFGVTVTGPTSNAVKSRARKFQSLLKELRRTHIMHNLPSWRPEHREAIMGTTVIAAIQQYLKTTAIFHFSNEGQVSAEVVSLVQSGREKMTEFLDALQPTDATWTIPPRLLREYDDPKWLGFRSKFAVKVDRSSKSGPKNQIKAFGFNGLLAEGHKALLGGEMTPVPLSFDFIISKLNITFFDLSEDITDFQLEQTFTFQDLSNYNFFLYFKEQFMSYISDKFHITIDPPFEREWNDNTQLNITLHGNTNNLNNAIAFLNTLQNCITKETVYFFRVLDVGYKNLLDLKSNLESELASIRDSSQNTNNSRTTTINTTTSTTDSSNLLNKVGFISLSVKPPTHQRGIRRTTFPVDIYITICGFSNTPAQQNSLRNIKEKLSEVNSDLLYHEMEIPSKSPAARILSKRTTRDGQVEHYGLEGIRWECPYGNATGTVRIWAKTQTILDNMINAIRNGLRIKATSPISQNGSSSNSNIIIEPEPEPIRELFRLDIAWPNPTLRFVFLAESSKRDLLNLLNQLEATYGDDFRVTTGIRDRRDASLCIGLEGSMEAIQAGKALITDFLGSISLQLLSVVLVMTQRQLDTLRVDDLSDVKIIQAGAGVHMVLDPTSSDVSDSIALYDMRVSKCPTATSTASMSENSDIILASAWSLNGHRVDIGICNHHVQSPGWGWQVNCLLQVIESNDGLSPAEIAIINSGGVLVVEMDQKTMLRVRPCDMNPIFSLWGDSNDRLSLDIPKNTDPSRNLTEAIIRGLEEAERLHLVGLAVIAPVDLISLHTVLTLDEIRRNIVDTVVNFVLEYHLIHLRRIVCLEVVDGTSSSYSSDDTTNISSPVDTSTTTTISTESVTGNYMVQSLLRLMETQPRLQLLSYDYPLPPKLRYSVADLDVNCAVERKVVIRGLEDGVTNAVKAVKHLVVHE